MNVLQFELQQLPTCICESWLLMTLLLHHHCFFIDPDDCKPGTPHHSCVFGDALSIHYRWALVKITQILMLSFEDKMFSMLIKKK